MTSVSMPGLSNAGHVNRNPRHHLPSRFDPNAASASAKGPHSADFGDGQIKLKLRGKWMVATIKAATDTAWSSLDTSLVEGPMRRHCKQVKKRPFFFHCAARSWDVGALRRMQGTTKNILRSSATRPKARISGTSSLRSIAQRPALPRTLGATAGGHFTASHPCLTSPDCSILLDHEQALSRS